MPKGYWLAQVEVTDPEGYKEYVAANRVAASANLAAAMWFVPAATRCSKAISVRGWW